MNTAHYSVYANALQSGWDNDSGYMSPRSETPAQRAPRARNGEAVYRAVGKGAMPLGCETAALLVDYQYTRTVLWVPKTRDAGATSTPLSNGGAGTLVVCSFFVFVWLFQSHADRSARR